MNKFYDIIVAKYREYIEYNTLVEQEKARLKDMEMKIANKFLEDNQDAQDGKYNITAELKTMLLDKFTFTKVFAQDAQMLYYNLYKLVEVYLELEDPQILPKEITDLCNEFDFTIIKTVMVADGKRLMERESGSLQKIRDSVLNSGEFERQFKIIEQQLKQQKPTSE